MKSYATMFLLALILVAAPCQAQLLNKLQQAFMGGQGQGQATMVGNVNLPPGQYMMTNVQTGQAFYVMVQNGRMFLTGQNSAPQMMTPGQGMMQQQQQQGGMGAPMNGGFGNFLKN